IFAPLGMKDSGFLIGSAQKKRVATLHNRRADGGLDPASFEMPQRPEFFMGGGGAFSTPRDYMTFLQALLNGGALHGVRILRPETVDMTMQNQIGELNVQEMRSARRHIPAASTSSRDSRINGACLSTSTCSRDRTGAPPAASPGRACSTATSGSTQEACHRRALHPGLAPLRTTGPRAPP